MVVLASIVTSCGVPVDIGMLEDTTSGGSGGPVTDDATLTDSMTGQMTSMTSMTSMTAESSSSGPDEPPPAVQHDFAILEGPVVDTGGESETGGGSSQSTSASTSASSTTGDTDSGDLEVGTLTITATTGTATCEDPFGIEPCPSTWSYSFRLPPDLQFVGATGVIDETNGFFTEAGPEPVDCGFGAGTLSGRFEITAIDDTHVAGRMFDLELTVESEVVFDAPICPS